ncbi:chaplin [Actinacidiphila glaucinigra]|uniref:chaplin n=1 Tax=Actinacidiphila glaucinigra TaxID=235986 RepID=UPI0038651B3B
MKRFSKAVALTVATGALVLGSATTALADGYGDDYGKGGYGNGYGHGYGDHGGANAKAVAFGSPGFLSGNVVQVPINIPINACGNTINIIAALNPAIGNVCFNH